MGTAQFELSTLYNNGKNNITVSGGTFELDDSSITSTNNDVWDGIAVNNGTLWLLGNINNIGIRSTIMAPHSVSFSNSSAFYGYSNTRYCHHGLNLSNGSFAVLNLESFGQNVFEGNDHDIIGDNNSNIWVLASSFRGSSMQPYSNINSTNPSTQHATHCYWQNGTPLVTPNVDVSNPLLSDPNLSIKPKDDNESVALEESIFLKRTSVTEEKTITEKIEGIEELNSAKRIMFKKDFEQALPEMYKLVDKYSNGFVGKSALVLAENILTLTKRTEEIFPMLEKYSNGESVVAKFAQYRKAYQYLAKRDYYKAIDIMKNTKFDKSDTNFAQARLYDLGVAYHDYLGEKHEAYQYFSELVNTYPECQLASTAKTFYGVKEEKYVKPTIVNENISETKLFSNYPNPFNPSTIIKYQLSKASYVSLKVYDIVGREVSNLVNSFQEKGSYDITFNAKHLSSGIYFYKLNVDGKQFTNKMLLTK
jgi:tetratricopeptide (TPR) repeat protein